jgi:hypothetical protein
MTRVADYEQGYYEMSSPEIPPETHKHFTLFSEEKCYRALVILFCSGSLSISEQRASSSFVHSNNPSISVFYHVTPF